VPTARRILSETVDASMNEDKMQCNSNKKTLYRYTQYEVQLV